ncbi:O-antigen ligase family protein [Heyndrickxia coagulans]|uniref:O-antigen ligase family protein n=1 Tax=Heyndrickxia coagulans TaxID=1398 RepID=UPI003D1F4ED7
MNIFSFLINILNQIKLPSDIDIYIGEIIYCAGLFALLLANIKKVKLDKVFNKYLLIPYCVLCLYILIYFLLPGNSFENVIKILIKYLEILILIVLSYIYFQLEYKRKYSFFLLCIPIFDYVGCYWEWYKFGDPLYSLHMGGSYIALIFLILNELYFKNIILKLLTFFTLTGLLLLGESRTGLLIIGSYLFIKMYLYLKNKKYKNSSQKILTFYLTGICSLLFLIILVAILINNLSVKTASNIERTALIQIAFDMFKKNILIGIGPNNFNSLIFNYSYLLPYTSIESMKYLSPHNVFIENLVQFGLIGCSLFIIPFAFILLKGFQSHKENFVIIIIVFLIINLGTGVLSGNNRFLFAFLIAFCFYNLNLKNKNFEH